MNTNVLERALSASHTKKGRLQRAALALLREHGEAGAIPTSIRFLFYEAVQRGIVSKEQRPAERPGERPRRPDQDFSEAVMDLRRIGIVPWHWIVDETRHVDEWRYASSVAEFIQDSVAVARLDLWDREPSPLILCESRSLSGVLAPTARQYLCALAATNGQVGGFLVTTIVPMFRDHPDRRILYLGDWDHQGHQIEAATRRRLEDHVGELDWELLAVTDEQVDEHELRRFARTKRDKRYKPNGIVHEAIETETLGQSIIVGLLQDRLDELLPVPLEDVLERERAQREGVAELLGGLGTNR